MSLSLGFGIWLRFDSLRFGTGLQNLAPKICRIFLHLPKFWISNEKQENSFPVLWFQKSVPQALIDPGIIPYPMEAIKDIQVKLMPKTLRLLIQMGYRYCPNLQLELIDMSLLKFMALIILTWLQIKNINFIFCQGTYCVSFKIWHN